jgi:putative peptidoglycan lipid II flippase
MQRVDIAWLFIVEYWKGKKIILNNDDYPQDNLTSVTTLEQVKIPPLSSTSKETAPKRRQRWFSKSFRFSLKSFLPGGEALSVRRFSITEAAFLLVLALVASRGLGVVRQVLFNILFGTSSVADAYYAAAYLPETLFELIAGGALTHAFIPVFLSYEKTHGQREAWRLTSLVFNVMLVALTLMTLVGEFFAPAFVGQWLVPGYSPAKQALTTNLTRILLLQPLLLGLGTVITSALNSKRQFLLSSISVAIYNVGLISGEIVTFLFRGVGIYGPTYGLLVAASLQVLVMVPALVKQGARYSFTWNLNNSGFREILRLLIPNALAVGIASILPIIDANFISMMPGGLLAAQRNAYLLFSLPLALISQAVGQAAMPQLADLSTGYKYVRLRQTLAKLLGTSLVFSILASLALYLFGRPAIHILFQHGAFDANSAHVTSIALLGYAIALPGHALAFLLILTFYAMKKALAPLYITLLALFTHACAILLFLHIFSGTQQIIAIPLSLAIDGLIMSILLGLLLFRHLRSLVREDKGMQRLARRRAYSLK